MPPKLIQGDSVQLIDNGKGWIEPDIDHISGDRRIRPRFHLELALSYRVLNRKNSHEGFGITQNLSSGGVGFLTEDTIDPGSYLELKIQWPVLPGCNPMDLVVRGYVTWNANGVAGVRMTQSRFHNKRQKAVSGAAGGFSLP
jgi:PilZ domain